MMPDKLFQKIVSYVLRWDVGNCYKNVKISDLQVAY